MAISRRVLVTGTASGVATLLCAPAVAHGSATTRNSLLSRSDWDRLVGQRFTLTGEQGVRTATLLEATPITRRQHVPGTGDVFALRFRVHGGALPLGAYAVSSASAAATPLLFSSASGSHLVAIINRWRPTSPDQPSRSL